MGELPMTEVTGFLLRRPLPEKVLRNLHRRGFRRFPPYCNIRYLRLGYHRNLFCQKVLRSTGLSAATSRTSTSKNVFK